MCYYIQFATRVRSTKDETQDVQLKHTLWQGWCNDPKERRSEATKQSNGGGAQMPMYEGLRAAAASCSKDQQCGGGGGGKGQQRQSQPQHINSSREGLTLLGLQAGFGDYKK